MLLFKGFCTEISLFNQVLLFFFLNKIQILKFIKNTVSPITIIHAILFLWILLLRISIASNVMKRDYKSKSNMAYKLWKFFIDFQQNKKNQ
jgi:hypothetical protein